jgi:hypothetical protein
MCRGSLGRLYYALDMGHVYLLFRACEGPVSSMNLNSAHTSGVALDLLLPFAISNNIETKLYSSTLNK